MNVSFNYELSHVGFRKMNSMLQSLTYLLKTQLWVLALNQTGLDPLTGLFAWMIIDLSFVGHGC